MLFLLAVAVAGEPAAFTYVDAGPMQVQSPQQSQLLEALSGMSVRRTAPAAPATPPPPESPPNCPPIRLGGHALCPTATVAVTGGWMPLSVHDQTLYVNPQPGGSYRWGPTPCTALNMWGDATSARVRVHSPEARVLDVHGVETALPKGWSEVLDIPRSANCPNAPLPLRILTAPTDVVLPNRGFWLDDDATAESGVSAEGRRRSPSKPVPDGRDLDVDAAGALQCEVRLLFVHDSVAEVRCTAQGGVTVTGGSR